MQNILDTFFSSTILQFAFILPFSFLFLILAIAQFFKKAIYNILFSSLMLVSVILLFAICGPINNLYWGYGFVNSFKEMSISEDYVVLTDGQMGKLGRGGKSWATSRLFVLNSSNGKLVYRKIIGLDINLCNPPDNSPKNELLYKQADNLVIWNLVQGQIKTQLNSHSLTQIFPQLSVGIDKMNYDNRDRIARINAKDGKNYFLNPFTLKISETEPIIETNKNLYYIDNDYIKKYDGKNENTYFNLSGNNFNDKIRMIRNNNNQILNPDLSFLDGQFLHVFSDLKQMVILHYETTENTDFILSCVSFDLKLQWQIRKKDLQTQDYFSKSTNLRLSAIYKNDLIFTVSGFVYSINTQNGKLNWQTRL